MTSSISGKIFCFWTFLSFFIPTVIVAEESSSYSEAKTPELTEEAEKAIERGLKFLISNQNKDGSWSSKDPENEESTPYAIGGTSLALMAFMVEGHFPGFGKYGKALDRAKDYLLKRAKDSPTGAMGVKMYEIGLFTIAMSELWGMTSDPKDNKEIQTALERVVQIILRSQNPLGGWRYAPRPDAGQTLRSRLLYLFPWHRQEKLVSSYQKRPLKESPVIYAIRLSMSVVVVLVIREKDTRSLALLEAFIPLNLQAIATPSGSRPP